MSLSSTCIKRPVFATVINVVLILIGFIGLAFLGVRDYPSVDPPIISVSTSFPGANADVIETQITEPLEAAINGIQGIRALTSTSRDGRSSITVEFELEVDLETAANDVRDKVSGAQRKLPKDVDRDQSGCRCAADFRCVVTERPAFADRPEYVCRTIL